MLVGEAPNLLTVDEKALFNTAELGRRFLLAQSGDEHGSQRLPLGGGFTFRDPAAGRLGRADCQALSGTDAAASLMRLGVIFARTHRCVRATRDGLAA